MSKFSNLKLRYKIGVTVATGAAIIAGGSAAFAYLSETSHVSPSGGTGSVSPSSGTVSNITWSAGTVTGLVPGGTSKNITITLSNSNSYSVNIGKWTFAVASVSGPTGCADNSVADLSGSATTPATFVVPAGLTNTVTVPVSMADLPGTDQSTCVSGAPLTVTFSATDANGSDTNV